MRKINKKTVILSAFRSDLSHVENYNRHCDLQRDLVTDFKYKIVTGHYKGSEEYSLVIPVACDDEIRILSSIAMHYDQDCILVINESNETFLHYPNGSTESIGTFKAVSKKYALDSENYTYDHESDIYYMAV